MRALLTQLMFPVAVLMASIYGLHHYSSTSIERSPASLKKDGVVIKRTVKKIKKTTKIVIDKSATSVNSPESTEQKPVEKPEVTEQKPVEKPEVTEQKPEEKPEVTEQKPVEKPEVTEKKPEEKPEVTEQKPEEKPEVTEQEASEDRAMVCVDEQDYNNMIDEIADLKERMKTIASAIPEDLFSEDHSNLLAQMQALQSMSTMNTLNWNSMYQPWSMNNYLMNNMMTNSMMGNSMNPFIQSQASQVLGNSYQPFYSPITINNFNYGSSQYPVQNTNIPSNYYGPEMNFGGLDQVNFGNNSTNSSQARTPAFFSF